MSLTAPLTGPLTAPLTGPLDGADAGFNPLSLSPLVYFDALGGSMLDSGGAAASHGDTVATLTDLGANGDDATQSTDSLRPVALTETGVYLPGVSGNYVSSTKYIPTSGVFRVEVGLLADDYTPAGNMALVSCYNSITDDRSWLLNLETTGVLRFVRSTDGTGGTNAVADSSVSVPDGTRYVAAEWDIDGGTVDFETSADGASWSALGTQQSLATAPFDATTSLEAGANTGGAANLFAGVITSVIIKQDGTIVRNLPFATSADAHGSTTVTAAVGPDGTINQSGDDPATLIRSSFARSDGSDDLMLIDLGSAVAQPFTIFMVAQAHAAPASPNGRLIHGSSASGTEADVSLIGANPDTSPDEFFINMGENEKLSDFDTDLHIFSVVANGASSTARQDGSDLGISVSASGSNGLGQYVSLFGRYHDGARCIAADLHACLIFDRALTTAEQEKLENYYNARLAVF